MSVLGGHGEAWDAGGNSVGEFGAGVVHGVQGVGDDLPQCD
ncbi:MAG: hypothetical protein ACRDPT_09990 [Streptomycetales bacterium]